MNNKMKFVGIFTILAAVCAVLCFGFIVLDVSVLRWTVGQLEGAEGLGVAIIISLCLVIAVPAAAINALFQIVCGALMLAYEKRERGVHKALRVIAGIVGVLATIIEGYFAWCFFSAGCAVWGICTAITAVAAFAVPILSAIAHKEE